ncbi:MAG: M20/M25/M40 family metallo-hydrolase, partial [Clostridia bacterium]|nr:M20/M25/M40 family metallo-hydrolase [Clostridia bacterium]
RVKELITLDGIALNALVTRAVGSHRYRVTVKTEGGHSFARFGNRNAIHCLSSMINTLYTVKVPVEGDSRTTYNVGSILGGTSVNTIAENAEMLYEYRSNNVNCLAKMKNMFEKIIEGYRATGIQVDVELLGERPCGREDIDRTRVDALLDRAADSIKSVLGVDAVYRSGSTDCNIPLSLGIPAVCISVCTGGGCHTRGEFLNLDSLEHGSKLFMHFLAKYF